METVWVLLAPGGRIDQFERTLLFLHPDYHPYVLTLDTPESGQAFAEAGDREVSNIKVLLKPKTANP